MTNYLAVLIAIAALAGASHAADSAPRYQSSGGSLTFTFVQAGAESRGSFRQFTAGMRYDERNPAGGSLEVTVQIGSLDTQDKDRDDALAGADLLDAKKYPTANYVADSFARRADGKLEAVGRLTLRGVTRELRIPLTIRDVAGAVELSGEVTIKRLDYGVGQGEWQSTEWVGDEVKLQYKVPMARSK
jgi:polyisoprenoid-binding protein YceI